jgi:hypothetical protein
MKLNHVRNSGGVKLVLGILLAACFVATSAQADSLVKGRFKLTKQVYWGKAVLGPGAYTLAVDRETHTIVICTAGDGKVIARENARFDNRPDGVQSQLLIDVQGHQRAVHALRMESIGEVFNSAHPFGQIGRAAQEALKAELVPVEVAKK